MPQESFSNEPKHKPGDVVWCKPTPHKNPFEEWPALGSQYEIDCKVLSSSVQERNIKKGVDDLGNTIAERVKRHEYHVITGHGYHIQGVPENDLVSTADKEIYAAAGYTELIEDTELAPKGTRFIVSGDYLANESHGIYIAFPRYAKIKHLFEDHLNINQR